MKDNYNIKINPPELSSEQIKQHQNFDALLASFEQAPNSKQDPDNQDSNWKVVAMNPNKRKRLKYAASAILTLIAASVLFSVLRQPLEEINTLQPPVGQINELLALNLQQPLPQLTIPVERQTVQAEEGEVLTYASGSKVKIPAAAFVDKNGAPVKGAVEITYREFNDPVDMFLAGIPKELNKHQDLQSTGMMEIKGFQNGEPVFLDANKKLDIELQGKMPVDMKPEDLGVYVYSSQEDAWNYTAKDQVEILKNTTTNTTINGENFTSDDPSELAPIIAQLEEERQSTKPMPPIQPEGVPSDMQVFDFEIDLENAPELAQYNQKVDFMAPAKDFTPATFDTVWTGMELTKNAAGNYVLTLEYENEQGEITTRVSKVEPVVVATNEAKQKFQQEQARYEQALQNWKEEIQSLAQAQINATETLVNIINRFQIERFGLWNCGKPIEWEEQTVSPTQFVNLEGKPIDLQEVFVAAQQQQFYYSAPSATNSSEVPLPTEEQLKQKIWAMSAAGELLVAEIEEGINPTVLPMRPVAIPSSAADLRTLLTL